WGPPATGGPGEAGHGAVLAEESPPAERRPKEEARFVSERSTISVKRSGQPVRSESRWVKISVKLCSAGSPPGGANTIIVMTDHPERVVCPSAKAGSTPCPPSPFASACERRGVPLLRPRRANGPRPRLYSRDTVTKSTVDEGSSRWGPVRNRRVRHRL